jgi:type VI secretion system protein
MRPSLTIALLAAALAGCASKPPVTSLQSIEILADAGANQNNATALDLVFVYDSSTQGLLPKAGPEWFEKKAALAAGLATGLDVVSLQVPPASTVTLPASPPFPARYKKAIGVYAYANYVASGGQPQVNLTPYRTASIMLAPDKVTLTGKTGK